MVPFEVMLRSSGVELLVEHPEAVEAVIDGLLNNEQSFSVQDLQPKVVEKRVAVLPVIPLGGEDLLRGDDSLALVSGPLKYTSEPSAPTIQVVNDLLRPAPEMEVVVFLGAKVLRLVLLVVHQSVPVR